MQNPKSKIQNLKSPRGFTLIELLIVMSILAILVALSVIGMIGALNEARAARTKAIINKIDALISERWEGYRTRTVPVRINPSLLVAVNAQPSAYWTARMRLYALRELMRLELPDRITDVTDGPVVLSTVPSVTRSYRRLALRATGGTITNWTREHQGAECLYLILATMKDGDKSALDYFSPEEVGDVDGDGMKEILDGWGQPIEFLRWAPGYSQQSGLDGQWGVAGTDDDGNGTVDDIFEAGWPGSDDIVPLTLQTRIGTKNPNNPNQTFAPDPYDPLGVDPRVCKVNMTWMPSGSITLGAFFPPTAADNLGASNDTFALKPLIFSAGPDKVYDIATILDENGNAATPFRYSLTQTYGTNSPPNDPYFVPPPAWAPQVPLGTPAATRGWADNITNHYTETQ